MRSRDICPLTRYVEEEVDTCADREPQDVVIASATFMLWERLYGVTTVSPTLNRLNFYCHQELQKEKKSQKQQQQQQQQPIDLSRSTGVFVQRPRSILTETAVFSSHGSGMLNSIPESTSLISNVIESNEICDTKNYVKDESDATEVKSVNIARGSVHVPSFSEVSQLPKLPQFPSVTSIAQHDGLFTAQQATYRTVAEDVTLPFSVDAPFDNEKDTSRLSEVLRVGEFEDEYSSESYRPVSRMSGRTSTSVGAPADPTRLTDTPPPHFNIGTISAPPPGPSLHMEAQLTRSSPSPKGKLRSDSQPEQSMKLLSHSEEQMQTCGTPLSRRLLSQPESQVRQPKPSLSSSPHREESQVHPSPKKRKSVNVTSVEYPVHIQPLGAIVSETRRRLADEDEEANDNTSFDTAGLIADTSKTSERRQPIETFMEKEKGIIDGVFDDDDVDEKDGDCVEEFSVFSDSRRDVFPDSSSPKRETLSVGQLPKLSIDRGSASTLNVPKAQRRSRRYRPPPFYDVAQQEAIDKTIHVRNSHSLPVGESADGLVFTPKQMHLVASPPPTERRPSLYSTPHAVAAEWDTPQPLFASSSHSPVSNHRDAGITTMNETEQLLNDRGRAKKEEEEEEEERKEVVVKLAAEKKDEVSPPQLTPLYTHASELPLSVSPSPSYKDYEWAARAQAALEKQQQRLRARTPPSTSPPNFTPPPSLQAGEFELPQLPKTRHQPGSAGHRAEDGDEAEAKAKAEAKAEPKAPRARGRQPKSRVSPACADTTDRSPPPVAPARTPPAAVSRKRSSAIAAENGETMKKRRRVSPQTTDVTTGVEFLLPKALKVSSKVQQKKKR